MVSKRTEAFLLFVEFIACTFLQEGVGKHLIRFEQINGKACVRSFLLEKRPVLPVYRPR
jgi:hypothetical protein